MLSSCESEIPPAPIVAWRNGETINKKGRQNMTALQGDAMHCVSTGRIAELG